jgi:hypothetical protein
MPTLTNSAISPLGSAVLQRTVFRCLEASNPLEVLACFGVLCSLRLTHLLALDKNIEFDYPYIHTIQYNPLATKIMQYLLKTRFRR